ncbi:MAG: DMT family transporter [Archaeoglobaceae archaeon]
MKPVILSLLAAVCWAVSGSFYKKALERVSPQAAVFHRSFVAAVLFLITSLDELEEVLRLDAVSLLILVASAFLAFFAGDLLYFYSLRVSDLSVAFPISSTYPIFVVLISYTYAGFHPIPLLSAVMVTAAIFILYWSGRASGAGYALAAALSWSLAIVSLDYLTARLSTETLAFYRMAIVLPFLAAMAGGEIRDARSFVFAGLLGGSVSFVGIYLFIDSVRLASSQLVVQPSASSAVFAALIGKVAFKEKVDARLAVALSLCVAATLLLLQLPPR